MGIRTSDFIIGWKRREQPLDIGIVDESSMLTQTQVDDLKKIFKSLILFGDPGQLSPVEQDGRMVFHKLPDEKKFFLTTIHRQSQGNPIIDLANCLREPEITYKAFDNKIKNIAEQDNRGRVASRVSADGMWRARVSVWRNDSRLSGIADVRKAGDRSETYLSMGGP